MVDKAEIAAELIRRGVSPEQVAAAGYPQIAQQARTGMIAPRFSTGSAKADDAIIGDQGKKLNADRDALGRAYPVVSQLERFQDLNERQRTGGIQHQDYGGLGGLERLLPQNWAGAAGQAVARYDPEVQEMSGIASVLQGQARPAGSGATSDFEQRLYRQGVPSPDKLGPVNQSIIAYQKGVVAEEQDRLAFNEEFFRRNGSLNGAQAAWGRYVAANPYTTPGDKGRVAPNSKRQDWRQHFGTAPQPVRAAPPRRPAGGTAERKEQVRLLREGAAAIRKGADPAKVAEELRRRGVAWPPKGR